MLKRIARHLATGALALAIATPPTLLVGFVGVNWATNCQSWDRELWTRDSSCVTPSEFLGAVGSMIVGEAEASDSVRRQQRDVERRISSSWEERLRARDRQREREEMRDRRQSQREWRRLTTTDDECEED